MTLYKNKYRIESSRLRGYDYSQPGSYFITICTRNRIPFFGEIDNDKMILSEIGRIVKEEWFATPKIRPNMNIEMDAFVIMPNHIHGIIVIYPCRDVMHLISTDHIDSNKFVPQSNNIPSIIRGIKSSVTIRARKINPDFAWQPRFYDHIIRTDPELNQIRQYIMDNPQNWAKDKNYLF